MINSKRSRDTPPREGGHDAGSRHSRLLAVSIMVLGPVAVAYLVLEFLVFPHALMLVPLDRHEYLHEGIRMLAQTSKSGTVPRDYIALVGDSYAQGAGDWFLSVDHGRNPPFNIAHLLHDASGRDVVTFGASGAGSLRGMAVEPLTRHRFVNRSRRFSVDAPRAFAVFFYEGNDLSDNLEDLARRYNEPGWNPWDPLETGAFGRFIEGQVVGEDRLSVETENFRWYNEFFFADFIYRTARRAVGRMIWGEEAYTPPPPEWHEGDVNRAVVGGDTLSIPDVLQGPELELSDREVELAVEVFEGALLYLRENFKDSAVLVVYIPSPLSCYELACDEVSCQTYLGRASTYPSASVPEKSEAVAEQVRRAAERNGVPFLDGRASIRAAARESFVHGPRDWKHLNRTGLEALAGPLGRALDELWERGGRAADGSETEKGPRST